MKELEQLCQLWDKQVALAQKRRGKEADPVLMHPVTGATILLWQFKGDTKRIFNVALPGEVELGFVAGSARTSRGCLRKESISTRRKFRRGQSKPYEAPFLAP